MIRPATFIFLALAALASPARAARFDSGNQGAIVDLNVGTAPVGDFLLGELGGESASLRTLGDGRWLLQWDALAALKGGTLAATHPFTTLLGCAARGYVEAGRRFSPEAKWSPYAGARLATEFQLMLPPGVGLSELRSQLDIDGVGDLNLSGLVRAAPGLSMLDGDRSLLVTVFLQEDGRIPEANLPGAAFTDVGLEARYDVARSLTLDASALVGTQTPMPSGGDSRLHALGYSPLQLDQKTSHTAFSLLFRKTFSNAMWFAASAAWSRESYVTNYESPSAEFDTTGAPTFTLTLLYGFPLGSQP